MTDRAKGYRVEGFTVHGKKHFNGDYFIKRQKIGGSFKGSRIAILYNSGGTCVSFRNKEYHHKDFWLSISDYIEKSIESGKYERIVVEYYDRGNVVFDWRLNK